MSAGSTTAENVRTMVDPRILDPAHRHIDTTRFSQAATDETVRILEAMSRWSQVERRASEASRAFMRLGETDMRAIRFLLAADHQDVLATPRLLAEHLGLTPAGVTKLIDRLVRDGHAFRRPHPHDRRSTSLHVSASTRTAASEHVGKSHAQRFHAVASLTSEQRASVLAFFAALTTQASSELR